MEKTLKDLEQCFEDAVNSNSSYIGVKIKVEGSEKGEIIINPRENFAAKLEYYKKAYNEDLTLMHNTNIKIANFVHGNSFNVIGRFLNI